MKRNKGWVVVFVVLGILSILLMRANAVRATFGDMHAAIVLMRLETEIMQKTPAGRYYESLVWKHNDELIGITYEHPEHRVEVSDVTRIFIPELEALLSGKGDTVYLTPEHIESLKAELEWFASVGSPALREDIQRELQRFPLDQFIGMTMSEAQDFVNSNWAPESIVEKSFVSGSNGAWAYYAYNGVYFEYPSSYDLQVSSFDEGSVYLIPSASTLAHWNACVIKVRVFSALPTDKDVIDPRAAYAPEHILWKGEIQNPEFAGVNFARITPDYPVSQIISLQYNEVHQLAVKMTLYVYQESEKIQFLDHPGMLNQEYEYLKHMQESLRIE